MPEGDTVHLAGQRLRAALVGERLTSTDFRVPQLATADLSGRTVLDVASRGKHLLTRVSGGLTLHTHFRMDGSWHLYRPGTRWGGGPDWQVRVVLRTAPWEAVGYRLPVVELLETAHEDAVVGHLGPDVLDETWGPELAGRVVGALEADPDRDVAPALLDQRVVAGLGNLYVNEVLFLQGVTPWTPVGRAGDLAALVDRAHRLLRVNRDRAEQATTGDLRPGRQHWVYERSGRPCRRCGTRLRSAEHDASVHARLDYWCPRCQRGPAPPPGAGAPRAARTVGRTRYRP